MWPTCGLELASPEKQCVYGPRNTFNSLHTKTLLHSRPYQLMECSQLYMYTQQPEPDQLQQAVTLAGTFLHTHICYH